MPTVVRMPRGGERGPAGVPAIGRGGRLPRASALVRLRSGKVPQFEPLPNDGADASIDNYRCARRSTGNAPPRSRQRAIGPESTLCLETRSGSVSLVDG